MTLVIELTPEQNVRLEAAARGSGIDPAEFARRLVADHLPPLAEGGEQERRARVMQELVEETERLGLYK